MNLSSTQQITIRISGNSLSFAINYGEGKGIRFENYSTKSGISIAANLREAFKECELLMDAGQKAQVIIDSPTLLLPMEDLSAEEVEAQYQFVYPDIEGKSIEATKIPTFKNIVVFAVSKDLKTVLSDHFEEVRIQPLMSRIWEFLLERSFGSSNKKLYAYFHDGKMELCSFNRNRFAYANTFPVTDMHDALFFILGAWKQIGGQANVDDVFLVGRIDERESFTESVKEFIPRVYYINPAADFNRAEATRVLNMPFDLMLQFL